MTFGMARDLYRRYKYVVYDSYWLPIGNYVITCGPKLPHNFFFLIIEVVDQNCDSTYMMGFRR